MTFTITLPAHGATNWDTTLDAALNDIVDEINALAASPGGVTTVNTRTGAVTLTKGDVGLSAVDNTSDLGKPVSTAQAALNTGFAPKASPTFTGTVSGITKAMVSLGSVDNTADIDKPVSNLQNAAIVARYLKPGGGIPSSDLASAVVTSLGKADSSIQNTDAIVYTRRYSSGAWPVRGTVPSSSIVEWIGPAAPPIDGTYALTGVDIYTATVS